MLVSASPSWADDDEPERDEINTVLFGSLEAGQSLFTNSGLKRALGGSLDTSGFLLMTNTGSGLTPERRFTRFGAVTDYRHTTQSSGLVGYQWVLGRTLLAAFVGPELDYEDLFAPRERSTPSRLRIGARFQAELWSHPTEATLATATLVVGSARLHAWGRASLGYRIWSPIFVGPEVSGYIDDAYREGRVGLHVTGMQLGNFGLRVSGGLSVRPDQPLGGYVGLSGHYRM